MTNTREEVAPETSFEFICEWFEKAADTAERQGKKDSSLLWRDGLQHLLHERASSKYLPQLVAALKEVSIWSKGGNVIGLNRDVFPKIEEAINNLPPELKQ